MKRFAIAFLSVLLTMAVGSAHAQVLSTGIRPVMEKPTLPPFITNPSHFNFPTAVTPHDSALAYFDPDSTGNFNWFFLPTHINLNLGDHDSLYVIDRYAERFSSTYTATYLDSITLVFAPLVFTDTETNRFLIEVRPQVSFPSGLLGFSSTGNPVDSAVFYPADLTDLNQVVVQTIPMRHKSVGKNFFIVLHTPDTNLSSCSFAIRGDSITYDPSSVPAMDPNLDRALWSTDGYIGSMHGITFTDQQSGDKTAFTPNFVIVAYVSNHKAGVNDDPKNPNALYPCFPNPVNKTTEISYKLAQGGPTSITLYDMLGNQVASVAERMSGAGDQSVTFDASKLPNGMYYYKLQSGDYTATRTMVVAK
jgi:hypothetical protein